METKYFFIPLIAATLSVSACIPSGNNVDRPRGNNGFSTPDARMCLSDLKKSKVSFAALPDRQYGGGCRAVNSVKLLDFGTPTTNLGPMTCTLASGFTGWARDIVRPAARKYLGSRLARIETSGTYSCRRVNGNGNLSQHAFANAVDVFAFVMTDGRKITVLKGWNGRSDEAKFLRRIHADACGKFGTVLGPSYNRQHADHFHLDMAKSRLSGNPFCR